MTCPSKLILEEYWLTGTASHEMREHVNGCLPCQQKMTAWEEERRSFLKKYSFERFQEEAVMRRQGFLKRFLRSLILPPPALRISLAFASIACLMMVILWPHHEGPQISPKGGATVGYYVSRGDERRLGEKEMVLSPGDVLEFFYSSERDGYLLLIGLDENGHLSTYFPVSGDESKPIPKGQNISLLVPVIWSPRASYERFFGLFSEHPISVRGGQDAVSTLLEGQKPEDITHLPLDADQTTFLLRKDGK